MHFRPVPCPAWARPFVSSESNVSRGSVGARFYQRVKMGVGKLCPGGGREPSRLVDRLYNLVALQPLLAAFRPKARVFDPAERRVGDGDGEGVDADHAALDEVADQIGAAAVLGKGEGGEAEGQAVGLFDGFLERVE